MSKAADTETPVIKRICIERFRGIERLVWLPEPGVNVILGGGDVGKTTILDAIAILLSPTHATVVSEADYWCRQVDEAGFSIEAVISLPDRCGISQQKKSVWPWEWSGEDAALPKMDEGSGNDNESQPVYRMRARGTADFDLVYELVQPDNQADHFSVALRRSIGLIRLCGDDRNDRDLRLIQGSALDRLLSDKTLRARLGKKLGETDVEGELQPKAKENLKSLDVNFEKQSLPTGLGLGLVGGPGYSLNALLGLTATKAGTELALSSWGAGTRRLAALEIAAAHQGDFPIILVDEIERGLEPYRQRLLINKLLKHGAQVFITTHSAATVSEAAAASVWYLDSDGKIGRLPKSVAQHQRRDPEAYLSRLTIVAEGPTEVGFVSHILERVIGTNLLQHGIWITDGGGNDHALKLLEGLSGSGLRFGGFADDEGRDKVKWSRVQHKLGALLFRWKAGCIEENVVKLLADEQLKDFIKDPEGDSGERLRTLADRLGLIEKDFASIAAKSLDLKALIIEAATGTVPEGMQGAEKGEKKAFKSHSQKWFKSFDGGKELAMKVFEFDLWPKLQPQLLPFINAIRTGVSLPDMEEFSR